ncbi:hypothetical protein [Planococcus sp. S3-L1]|uniref:hypothetical protein n=1 Tax=Planococcus sp. S3-L1 TaxID=3046200 RepID=UPI0024B8A22D|nr:hypothetical protein [Planococcus sp. S3-L1]MDJ0332973.1 hypothetical protein [Planococcus sp. S3-L1]
MWILDSLGGGGARAGAFFWWNSGLLVKFLRGSINRLRTLGHGWCWGDLANLLCLGYVVGVGSGFAWRRWCTRRRLV